MIGVLSYYVGFLNNVLVLFPSPFEVTGSSHPHRMGCSNQKWSVSAPSRGEWGSYCKNFIFISYDPEFPYPLEVIGGSSPTIPIVDRYTAKFPYPREVNRGSKVMKS